MNRKYLVVVHAPVTDKSIERNQAASYTVATPPSVQHITASSPQKAAELANVKPGGYALVAEVSDVRRFDRAEQAPLEERDTSGGRLPEAVAA